VEEERKQLTRCKVELRRASFELSIEVLSQAPEVMGTRQAGAPGGMRNTMEMGRGAGVRQLSQGIESQQLADQEIEEEVACPVGKGSEPLSNGGASRARWGQLTQQPTPPQATDQVEEDNVLQQMNHKVPMGMQKVGQQAVGTPAGLATNPLDQDRIVGVTRASPSLVSPPTNQAAAGLTVGMRTAIGQGKVAAREGDGFDILLYRTGKVLYNDHVVGTPPPVVGCANLGTRREVSSFLLECVPPANGAPSAGSAPLCLFVLLLSSSSAGVRSALCLSHSSFNLAIYLSPPIVFGEPVVLFGRDWACFDQRKWPITI
jgi:hypothetical protein